MFDAVFIKINKSWLDKNPDPMILYNMIKGQLPLKNLQRIIVKEVLSYVISNKRYQYQDIGKQ